MRIERKFTGDIARIVRGGGVGVIPTDTIYGIVGAAFSKDAVKKIYRLRNRNPKKASIILIDSQDRLSDFDIHLDKVSRKVIKKAWPGPISIIFPFSKVSAKKFSYLRRGEKSLAFRVPGDEKLRNFLRQAGPVIAPSANTHGMPPAKNIKEAQKYFGDKVDFYVDGGARRGKPSTLIELQPGGIIKTMRKGVVKI